MRNKKGYQIIRPLANEERFSNYHRYFLFWVAVGYYLWKKLLGITGYRFHPTDFELLHFYLQNKNLGRDSLVQAIAEVDDICGLEPWQLPGHSNIHSGDQVWYFFYRPSFKYQNSSRINRTTNEGYWKPTGKPRKIMARDMETEIGKKKTLVFYKGRVDKIKTGWIMHEYELTSTLPNQAKLAINRQVHTVAMGRTTIQNVVLHHTSSMSTFMGALDFFKNLDLWALTALHINNVVHAILSSICHPIPNSYDPSHDIFSGRSLAHVASSSSSIIKPSLA